MDRLALNGILLFLYYLTLFSVSFTYYQERRTAGGKPLYVSIPEWALKEGKVKELLAGLTRRSRILTCMFAAFSLYFYLPLPYKGVICAISVFLMFFIYSGINKKSRNSLLAIKKEEQWTIEAEEKGYQFDLSLSSGSRKKLPALLLLIPAAVQAGCIIASIRNNHTASIASNGFFMILLIILYIFWTKSPAVTYCDDTKINQLLNESRRYYIGKFIFLLAINDALVGVFLLFAGNLKGKSVYFTTAAFAFITVIILTLAIQSLVGLKEMKERVLKGKKKYSYNEDEFWKIGLLGASYNNPYDPAIFKANNSKGTSCGINMGNPKARLMAVVFFSALFLLLSYFFLYPWVLDVRHELTELTIDKQRISVTSPFYKEEVEIDRIQKVELLEKIPNGIRTFGTANGIYATGNYRLEGIGNCRMYIAARHKPFIVCYTENGVIIINDDEKEKTEKIYKELNSLLGEEISYDSQP